MTVRIPGQSQVPGLPQPPSKTPPPSKRAKRAIQRRLGLRAPARTARAPSFRTIASMLKGGSFWGFVRRQLPAVFKQHRDRGDFRNHGAKGSTNGYTGRRGMPKAPWLKKRFW